MIAVHAPPLQVGGDGLLRVHQIPNIPIAPAPFATNDGYSGRCSVAGRPIAWIVHAPPRSVENAYPKAAGFASCCRKTVSRSPVVTMMFGFVSSAVVVATATGAIHVRPSSSDRATYRSWFVGVTSLWNTTYVRPRLSRASLGRSWFAGSDHTGTFGANGSSFGCGPGPEAGDA